MFDEFEMTAAEVQALGIDPDGPNIIWEITQFDGNVELGTWDYTTYGPGECPQVGDMLEAPGPDEPGVYVSQVLEMAWLDEDGNPYEYPEASVLVAYR